MLFLVLRDLLRYLIDIIFIYNFTPPYSKGKHFFGKFFGYWLVGYILVWT